MRTASLSSARMTCKAAKEHTAARDDVVRIDGVGRWNGFRLVALPYLKATLALVLIYETIVAVATFDLVYVMTGGGPADATAIIGWYAYTEIFRFLDLGHGAALAIILAVVLLGLVLVYLRALRVEEPA